MHRSRIGVVLIDHPASSFDDAVTFWAGVQRLGSGTPRVHLDIETDDVAAEVTRVVDLGARIVEERDGYTILNDPGGLVFGVVPVQNAALFEAHANTWK